MSRNLVSLNAKCTFFSELLTNDSKIFWDNNFWKSTSGIELLQAERHDEANGHVFLTFFCKNYLNEVETPRNVMLVTNGRTCEKVDKVL
jgi:hypothetical protein